MTTALACYFGFGCMGHDGVGGIMIAIAVGSGNGNGRVHLGARGAALTAVFPPPMCGGSSIDSFCIHNRREE